MKAFVDPFFGGSTLAARRFARVATFAIAVGSNGFLIYAAPTNTHCLITAAFVLWVTAPLAAIFWLTWFAKRWGSGLQIFALLVLILVMPNYSGIFVDDYLEPREAQRAFVYVLAPGLLWAFILVWVFVCSAIDRLQKRSST